MSPEQEARIRTLAYELWEKEGRPDGRDKDHWDQAAAMLLVDVTTGKKKAEAPGQTIAAAKGRRNGRVRSHVHA
jgi:hypothetical protein